jgi:hypothetical protein
LNLKKRRHRWLMPVILAEWKAEIGRISVGVQPRQTVLQNNISKNNQAKWTGGMT